MDKLIKVSVDQTIIANNVAYADTAQLRKKGVLGRQTLDVDEGVLLIMPRRAGLSLFHPIHMFGVPFNLAVAWLDKQGAILHLKLAKPNGFYFPQVFSQTPNSSSKYTRIIYPYYKNQPESIGRTHVAENPSIAIETVLDWAYCEARFGGRPLVGP